MAAVLDISILNSFTIVIVFLLVFIGGWGILLVVNPFKQEQGKNFYGLMSFLLALVVVISRKVVNVILFATPWIIIVALIAFFFIFFAKMFFVPEASIMTGFKGNLGWLIFFLALIMVFAIGTTFGPDLLPATLPAGSTNNAAVGPAGNYTSLSDAAAANGSTATTDFGTNLTLTIFHPKVIGVLFLFLLGTLTILLLAGG